MNRKVNITVIGYPKILSQCRNIAEEYLDTANFLYYHYRANSGSVKYMDASPDHPFTDRAEIFTDISHDIIVVGIVTAKMMTTVDKNKIIPFRAGSKAIIKAFSKARAIADHAAFISPVEEKHDHRFYEKLTGLKIDIYYAENLQDYRRFCSQAKQDGHSVVVGGSYTFQIAREYGLKPVFLFSDEDIFHDAFARALETFRYNQSVAEKVSQLEIISQKSENCIVFIDKANRITFSNNVTEQKLGLKARDIGGKHVSEVFAFLDTALLEKTEDSEIIASLSGAQILVTLNPVFVGEQTVGTVLFVKKTTDIAALDTRVRQKIRLRDKGFRARYTFEDILGNSPAIRECREKALKYAGSEAPVLIYGKTGTGKELFAQSIHNASGRKPFPFVAINCATLPADLMESELFGYVKGAFTGARSQGKQGLVDQAHLGTLFLDEVDSLPISLQAKLLRLLQEKEFIRVGGNEVIPVDIRVIAACNRRQDPGRIPVEVADQSFLRQDLFYRLSVLYLSLPDLARRQEDVLLLFLHFLNQSDSGLAQVMTDTAKRITPVLDRLPFTGNLRELQSISTRFACLYDSTQGKEPSYIENLLTSCSNTGPDDDGTARAQEGTDISFTRPGLSLSQSMALAEKAILRSSRDRHQDSVQSMADQLGIGRTTLWRKLKDHGIT
ncbi:MAG: AAA domain-containing protein [Desulfobacteraceae bacterium]|nr:AAA domain-containing protein [Desulfobacteraceae bacterium]